MSPEHIDKSGVKHFYNEKLGIKDTRVCLTNVFLDEEDFETVIEDGKEAVHIGTMKEPCAGAGEYETLARNGTIFWAHKSRIKSSGSV
jgi:hypothetical protein